MWISYEDKALSDFAVYELEDKDVYDINNHHDTFIATQRMSAHDDDVTDAASYMANIFVSPDDRRSCNAFFRPRHRVRDNSIHGNKRRDRSDIGNALSGDKGKDGGYRLFHSGP